jgi:hypothetical protein
MCFVDGTHTANVWIGTVWPANVTPPSGFVAVSSPVCASCVASVTGAAAETPRGLADVLDEVRVGREHRHEVAKRERPNEPRLDKSPMIRRHEVARRPSADVMMDRKRDGIGAEHSGHGGPAAREPRVPILHGRRAREDSTWVFGCCSALPVQLVAGAGSSIEPAALKRQLGDDIYGLIGADVAVPGRSHGASPPSSGMADEGGLGVRPKRSGSGTLIMAARNRRTRGVTEFVSVVRPSETRSNVLSTYGPGPTGEATVRQ